MADFDRNDMDQGEGGHSLVGQRSENSVLFSLDNLVQAETPDNVGESDDFAMGGSDQSGLIDLNTLAKLGAGSAAGAGTGQVSNLFVNHSSRRSKKGLWIGIVIVVLILLGVGGFLVYQKMENQRKAEIARMNEEKARLEKEAEEAKKLAEMNEAKLQETRRRQINQEAEMKAALEEAAKAEAAQVAQNKELNEAAKANEESSHRSRSRGSSRGSSRSDSDSSKSSGSSAGKGPNPSDVKAALIASSNKAKKCAKGGTLTVAFKLQPSGRATSVKAIGGSFQGSSTERCIITVVEKSDFPKFSGKSLDVKFTYKL